MKAKSFEIGFLNNFSWILIEIGCFSLISSSGFKGDVEIYWMLFYFIKCSWYFQKKISILFFVLKSNFTKCLAFETFYVTSLIDNNKLKDIDFGPGSRKTSKTQSTLDYVTLSVCVASLSEFKSYYFILSFGRNENIISFLWVPSYSIIRQDRNQKNSLKYDNSNLYSSFIHIIFFSNNTYVVKILSLSPPIPSL